MDGDRRAAVGNVDPVEALLLLANPGRRRGARLNDENAAGPGHEIARILVRGMMIVPGEQHVDAGFLDRVERHFLSPNRALDLLTDLEREAAGDG